MSVLGRVICKQSTLWFKVLEAEKFKSKAVTDLVSDEGLFFKDAILPLYLCKEKEASRLNLSHQSLGVRPSNIPHRPMF